MTGKLAFICLVLLAIVFPVQGQSLILTKINLVPISTSNAASLKTILNEKFDAVQGVMWSPGGTLLAAATSDGVWLYSYFEEPRFLANAGGTLSGAAFSPKGDVLSTELRNSNAGKIQVWDIASRTSREIIDAAAPDDYGIAYNPQGVSMVTAGCQTMCASERLFTVPDAQESARLLAISPDGERMISIRDRTLHVWDAYSQISLYTINDHEDDIHAAAFAPDNSLFVSGGLDGKLVVREASSGTLIRLMSGAPVNALAFSPDGSLLVVGSADNTLTLLETRDWETVATLTNPGNILSLAFSPDGTRLAVGGDSLTVWGIKAA